MGTRAARTADDRILYEIISTVASSLRLDEVLASVVRLLSDAAAVHACFVYLAEDGAERLVLAAASEPYGDLVGGIALERGEGLGWWAVERGEAAFIRENALADPRVKYVPELEEEHFQSLVAVPMLGRDGEPIGAILLHTEAPREFTDAEVDVLASSASLVGGAIENARLYEETRRRVRELEHLTELGETAARAESRDELLPAVADRARRLLGASACHVYVLDASSDELTLHSSAPPEAAARRAIALSELARSARSASVAVPLVATDELLGLLVADDTSEVDLARAVANQAAVALKKIDVIERLTEKNAIKDFFEELAGGRPLLDLEARARRIGFDVAARYLVIAASPPDDTLEKTIAAAAPGSLFDRRDNLLRGLVRIPRSGETALVERIRSAEGERERETAVGIGVSSPCSGPESFAAGFEEARHALLGTTVLGESPGVMTYDELGPYKYLLRMSLEEGVRDRHRDAVARLAEYDGRRSTSLLRTLEEFLRRRGNISATAEALYVHPNTLRQRLRRIMELTGIDLRRDDWLMVEIAVKMVKLEQALGGEPVAPAPG